MNTFKLFLLLTSIAFVTAKEKDKKKEFRVVQTRSRKLRSSEHRLLLARNACAGISEDLHRFCFDDVLMTGDASYAGSYKIEVRDDKEESHLKGKIVL